MLKRTFELHCLLSLILREDLGPDSDIDVLVS
jgi:hypothetical protein